MWSPCGVIQTFEKVKECKKVDELCKKGVYAFWVAIRRDGYY